MDDQPSTQPSRRARWAVLISSAAIVLTIDQITKALIIASLSIGETWVPFPALADFFVVTRSANTGAALGILPQGGNFFLLIAIIMALGVVVFYPRMTGRRWLERIALGMLLGGALGNAVDRIRLGYVVDFVHLQLKPLISNVSNIADHSIVIGVVLLLIIQWWDGRNAAKATDQADQADQNGTLTKPDKLPPSAE